jgi:ABC-type branched-subunit amino acid transport system substrate-binding protein
MKTHPNLKGTERSPTVQLLGVEAWNSSAVIDGERLTDNAVFVDTFFHDPDDRAVDRFVRGFYARHRRKPTAFQAEVYDAVSLLSTAMGQVVASEPHGAEETSGADQTVRERLLKALLGTKHHRGVTGHITVLDDGTMVLQPRVLTVHLDDIRLRVSEDEEVFLRRRARRPRGDSR